MTPDPLDDPDVTAALKIIGSGAPSGRVLCPRCTSRWIDEDDELCRGCTHDAREAELATKRAWWHRRGAIGATARQGARTWLTTELRKGPRRGADIKRRADAAGISLRTLERVAAAMSSAGELEYQRRGNGPGHHTLWALTHRQQGEGGGE